MGKASVAALCAACSAVSSGVWHLVCSTQSQCESGKSEAQENRRPMRMHWFGTPPVRQQHVVATQGNPNACPSLLAVGGGVVAATFPDGSLTATAATKGDGHTLSLAAQAVSSLAVDGVGSILFVEDGSVVKMLRRSYAGGGWEQQTTVGELDGIEHLSCGAAHCIALDKAGNAFSWATSERGEAKGALGRTVNSVVHGMHRMLPQAKDEVRATHSLHDADPALPARIEMPLGAGKIVSAACGDAHSMLLGEDGRLWAFGSDRWLQLGLGATWENGASHRARPTPVSGLAGRAVAMVACGGDHSIAALRDGEVVAWGRGREGQLGSGAKVFASAGISRVSGTPSLPPLRVKALAAAGHCSLVALEADGHEGGLSLWWLGRCPVPKDGQLYDGEECHGVGGAMLGMGAAVAQGSPKGGDGQKTAAAVGLLPGGTHLGEGCASCRAKSIIQELARGHRGS